MQELQELTTLSSRWTLSEVTAKLQHHMVYSCKVRKYGTLVYRPNSDLILLLSEVMWKLWNVESTQGERPEVSGCTDQFDHINQLVLSQIKTFLAKDAQAPFEYDEVNFDDLINQIDSQLWRVICLLTGADLGLEKGRGTCPIAKSKIRIVDNIHGLITFVLTYTKLVGSRRMH